MLIAPAKISEILWETAWLLVTRVYFIYQGVEFIFLFLAQLNGMNALGESNVLSICFGL